VITCTVTGNHRVAMKRTALKSESSSAGPGWLMGNGEGFAVVEGWNHFHAIVDPTQCAGHVDIISAAVGLKLDLDYVTHLASPVERPIGPCAWDHGSRPL